MFDTLAFSKGEIFILIVLAVSISKYLYTRMKRPAEWLRRDLVEAKDALSWQNSSALPHVHAPKIWARYNRAYSGLSSPPSSLPISLNKYLGVRKYFFHRGEENTEEIELRKEYRLKKIHTLESCLQRYPFLRSWDLQRWWQQCRHSEVDWSCWEVSWWCPQRAQRRRQIFWRPWRQREAWQWRSRKRVYWWSTWWRRRVGCRGVVVWWGGFSFSCGSWRTWWTIVVPWRPGWGVRYSGVEVEL